MIKLRYLYLNGGNGSVLFGLLPCSLRLLQLKIKLNWFLKYFVSILKTAVFCYSAEWNILSCGQTTMEIVPADILTFHYRRINIVVIKGSALAIVLDWWQGNLLESEKLAPPNLNLSRCQNTQFNSETPVWCRTFNWNKSIL